MFHIKQTKKFKPTMMTIIKIIDTSREAVEKLKPTYISDRI